MDVGNDNRVQPESMMMMLCWVIHIEVTVIRVYCKAEKDKAYLPSFLENGHIERIVRDWISHYQLQSSMYTALLKGQRSDCHLPAELDYTSPFYTSGLLVDYFCHVFEFFVCQVKQK